MGATQVLGPPVGIGEVIGDKYRIDRATGVGGMGAVYEATHTDLRERVAIKFPLPRGNNSTDAAKRLLAEARIVAQLRSKHVARVRDYGIHNGIPYIVMDLLEGETLRSVMRDCGSVAPTEAVTLIMPVLDALEEAHANQIIHCDLKPENLFVTKHPQEGIQIKVLDFGLARVLRQSDIVTCSVSANMRGTPAYMSPEHIWSAGNLDKRTDIWAVGVILYELISGALPFANDNLPQLAMDIAQRSPTPLNARVKDIPVILEVAIARCLEKERDNRFATVAELRTAIRAFAGKSSQKGPFGTKYESDAAAKADQDRKVSMQLGRRHLTWVADSAILLGAFTFCTGALVYSMLGQPESTAPTAKRTSKAALPQHYHVGMWHNINAAKQARIYVETLLRDNQEFAPVDVQTHKAGSSFRIVVHSIDRHVIDRLCAWIEDKGYGATSGEGEGARCGTPLQRHAYRPVTFGGSGRIGVMDRHNVYATPTLNSLRGRHYAGQLLVNKRPFGGAFVRLVGVPSCNKKTDANGYFSIHLVDDCYPEPPFELEAPRVRIYFSRAVDDRTTMTCGAEVNLRADRILEITTDRTSDDCRLMSISGFQ